MQGINMFTIPARALILVSLISKAVNKPGDPKGLAPVLFWMPVCHPGTYFKDTDVKYPVGSLRSKIVVSLHLNCIVESMPLRKLWKIR